MPAAADERLRDVRMHIIAITCKNFIKSVTIFVILSFLCVIRNDLHTPYCTICHHTLTVTPPYLANLGIFDGIINLAMPTCICNNSHLASQTVTAFSKSQKCYPPNFSGNISTAIDNLKIKFNMPILCSYLHITQNYKILFSYI